MLQGGREKWEGRELGQAKRQTTLVVGGEGKGGSEDRERQETVREGDIGREIEIEREK